MLYLIFTITFQNKDEYYHFADKETKPYTSPIGKSELGLWPRAEELKSPYGSILQRLPRSKIALSSTIPYMSSSFDGNANLQPGKAKKTEIIL